ncbi:MAG TPA: prenyltransferase/squalene oxidase repeat-containing protein [Gemmataceae bacterium]|nr:prenyltransferase/squalene oxidase repeat-containing protein [Gemmataceae bacterium]
MTTFTRRDWLRTASAAAVSPALLSVFPNRSAAAPSPADIKSVVDPAVKFLATKQNEDGSLFPKGGGPGITALTVAALVRHGYGPDTPLVAKGLKYLEGNIKPDGGVYSQGLANYTTCLAIIAFKEANTGGKYDKVIENASKFVRSLQYGEGVDPKDVRFGGAGYGKPGGKDRPDVSNTQFWVEAMIASGVSKDDPGIKKALTFISRSQNLQSEYNDQPFATKASDDDKGGFVYNPLDQDNEKSDKRTPAGGLRSEGGMTYAGLKSFLYAGVGKDDPRVKAAIAWIKKHYTLSENPGQGQAGLYYYYHTFAKAMDALGEDPFEDAKGVKHDWRQELFDELKKKQAKDGSWANPNGAFLENVPELATAFAILALSYCTKK